VAKLDEAIAELPKQSSMVSALLSVVSPAQAANLGISTQIDVPDTAPACEPVGRPGARHARRRAAGCRASASAGSGAAVS